VIVIGYLRVSTEEQARSGLGMDAQREAIEQAAKARGWHVTWAVDDGYSGSTLKRPALVRALEALRAGEAEGLVVNKLDRLSRSAQDFANTMAAAKKQGWALVALDLGVDTTTPSGKLMAGVMAQFAEYERELISTRTKDALAAAKARGQRLGRPRAIDPALLARIVTERTSGSSLRAIAKALNDEGVPPVRDGRCWHPATIRGLVESAALDEADTDLSTTTPTPSPLPTKRRKAA